MEYDTKSKAGSQSRQPSPFPVVPAPLQRHARHGVQPPGRKPELERAQAQQQAQRAAWQQTSHPTGLQRQAAAPALQAAQLQRQEGQRLDSERATLLQRQRLATPSAFVSSVAVPQVGLPSFAATTPLTQTPSSPAQWVQAAQLEIQRVQDPAQPDQTRMLGSAEMARHKRTLQTVTQALAGGFKADRGPAVQRYAEYGEHLATLQRHSLTRIIPRVFMTQIPAGERATLQRAVDDALQRLEAQDTQDAAAHELQSVQRRLAELEEESTQPVLSRIQARRGSGNPLPASVQRHLELGLNHDLSGVRIHDDSEADVLARKVNAVAFTTGKDVYFRSGQYQPMTGRGLELLAHELTHVKQQAQGRVGPGVDPDAGLEAEARESGVRLAARQPAFGTLAQRNKRQPGSLAAVRSAPPAVGAASSPTAIQRWSNPLDKLAKVAQRAKKSLNAQAAKVSQAARQTVAKVVKKTQAVARPALKAAQKAKVKLSAQVKKATASISRKAKNQGARLTAKVKAAVAPAVQKLKKTAQAVRTTLKKQSAAVVKSAGQALQKTQAAVGKQLAAAAKANAAKLGAAKAGARAGVPGAGLLMMALPFGQVSSVTASHTQKSQSLKQRAAALFQAGLQRVNTVYRQTKDFIALPTDEKSKIINAKLDAGVAAVGQLWNKAGQYVGQQTKAAGDLAQKGWNWTKATAKAGGKWAAQKFEQAVTASKKGWNSAVATGKAGYKLAVQKVNDIKNNPKVQRIAAKLKSAGIVVAKVGTAVIVGGAVIVGAAALTAATGGLAGPALVAALFASGALGGAAAEVVGNALTGKKWNTNVNAKSMAVDGLMGVAAGPLAKVAGGVVKAVAKPLVGWTGQALAGGGRMIGGAVGRAANRFTPGLVPVARAAALSVRNKAAALAARAAAVPGRVSASRLATRARTAAGKVKNGLNTAGTWIGNTRPLRGLKAVDGFVSKGLRAVASVPGRVGSSMGRPIKAAVDASKRALYATPTRRRLMAAASRKLAGAQDALSVAGIRVRNGIAGKVGAGWRGFEARAFRLEDSLRTSLASRGLNISTTNSVTQRVFAASERVLTGMKTYAAAEARSISSEVRKQWYGSAGVGGVLRTGKEMEKLVAANPALQAAWASEQAHAARILTNAAARAMRNEAMAVGQSLSRTAARRAATSQITPEAIYDYAVRNMRGGMMTRATRAYQAGLPGLTGFDPQKGWFGQLPRLYATGVGQMVGGIKKQIDTLRNAGGFAAGAGTAAGWLGDKGFGSVFGSTLNSYKTDPDATYPNASHLATGLEKARDSATATAISATTGLSTQGQFGPYMPLAPLEQVLKTDAGLSGASGTVGIVKLKPLDEPKSADEDTPPVPKDEYEELHPQAQP